jgi:hypothetical protein
METLSEEKTHMTTKIRMLPIKAICIPLSLAIGAFAQAGNTKWEIVLNQSLAEDEAIKVVLADLENIGRQCDYRFDYAQRQNVTPANVVLLGNAAGIALAIEQMNQGKIKLPAMANPEGYEIFTTGREGGKSIIVSGGSAIGAVYGLCWVWDRMRVYKTIPDINVKREPDLKIRKTRSQVTSKEDLKRALRFGVNVVFGENPLNLIPWNSEPERTENEKNRAKTRELVAYAHALHMKYLAFGTDFTYHPSLLQEFAATLSPGDPAFWDALQAKYRRLFQAMPELDGLADFLGEEQTYWGNYQTFDPIHDGAGCDWSLEKRYQTFIKKIYNVVVGEFDKLYFHITWDTNPYEQHAQPQIYKRIFDDKIPVKNLYLAPSSTQNDRWWFQAFNPTFNLTPHNMVVVFETMDYHHGANVFPTYPGPYFQAWLQLVMEAPECNLRGANLDMPSGDAWETRNLTAYTISRLSWNFHEDVRRIAHDFAAIHFGQAAATGMAEILLLSPIAYKYGLYIEPITYGQFTSLPQIRVGSFVVQGFPSIDKGKDHIEFLRKIYVRCKPWIPETLSYLDHGLETAEAMCQKYRSVESTIPDKKAVVDTRNSLEMTRLLIKTSNLYVKTFFCYFQYLENPFQENKNRLYRHFADLQTTSRQFTQVPGFGYDLAGVNQLLRNTESLLEDVDKATQILASAPTMAEIERGVAQQQLKYVQVLLDHANDAVKFLHWEGRVDGIDILKIRDKTMDVEHIKWDDIYFKEANFVAALPQSAVTVIPKDLESRPMHPFVLEQPSKENNYTVKILLNDLPPGAGWCKFDLYYVPGRPEKLGLANPWEK